MTDITSSDNFLLLEYTDQDHTSSDSATLEEEQSVWYAGIESEYQPPFEADIRTIISGIDLQADPPMRGDKMADWYMTQGDTAPRIRGQLTENSDPVDLSDASVEFRMTKNGTVILEEDATIESASTGMVYYQWSDGDTDDSVGIHEASFIVTWNGGLVQTFPSKGFIVVQIQPSVS